MVSFLRLAVRFSQILGWHRVGKVIMSKLPCGEQEHLHLGQAVQGHIKPSVFLFRVCGAAAVLMLHILSISGGLEFGKSSFAKLK